MGFCRSMLTVVDFDPMGLSNVSIKVLPRSGSGIGSEILRGDFR